MSSAERTVRHRQQALISRWLQSLRFIMILSACTSVCVHADPAAVVDLKPDPVLSVGRLLVPGVRYRDGYAKHFDERCSATLVTNRREKPRSDLILSAWHCIEHYRDLSRTLVYESSDGHRREARILASGDGMHADWLLLRLSAPLTGPTYIALSPDADTAQGSGALGTALPALSLLMAGYPRDFATNNTLETVSGCVDTGWVDRDVRSDCVLQKGASGGAVFENGGAQSFLGVISRGDGETQSIYVPLQRFSKQIRPFFKDAALLHSPVLHPPQ